MLASRVISFFQIRVHDMFSTLRSTSVRIVRAVRRRNTPPRLHHKSAAEQPAAVADFFYVAAHEVRREGDV
jgi:hypothetical protein